MYFQQREIERFMIANRNRLLHFEYIYWPKSVPVWVEKLNYQSDRKGTREIF